MKTSSVTNPENSSYIQLHKWQVKFCENNHCAALLLSFITAWHDWKTRNDQYYKRSNDIAQMHGDGRPHNENAYLFFSSKELVDGCMGLYGKKAIADALKLLVELGVISVHENPNPRYHFDKTKYFQFYPQVCNRWISKNYPNPDVVLENVSQDHDCTDRSKLIDRNDENILPSHEKEQPSLKNTRYITNTTNNTTKNSNQSIKASENSEVVKTSTTQELIIEKLTQQGLSEKHFKYPDTIETIKRLCDAGATVDLFLEAYSVARSVSSNGFGINYLAKIVTNLIQKNKQLGNVNKNKNISNSHPTEYKEEFEKGMDWMGDLI